MGLTPADTSWLDPSNPAAALLVFGPVGAVILMLFIYEIVVSGRAHKRELDENARLREIVETVIPLAQTMTELCGKAIEVLDKNTEVLRQMSGVGSKNRPTARRRDE